MKANGAVYGSAVWISKKTYRIILIVACAFLALLIIFPGAMLLAQDVNAHGRFPQNVRVCGVDVSGMTQAAALAACKEKLVAAAAQPLALKIDDEVYQTSPSNVGLVPNYTLMIDSAYKKAWNVNVLERLTRRFLRRPKAVRVGPAVTYDEAQLEAFVRSAMGSINRKAQNAYIDVSTGEGHISKAKDGRDVSLESLLAQAKAGLSDGQRQITVTAKRTPYTEGDEKLGRYIQVNCGSHTLSLYDRDTLLARYPVAVGSPQYPTVLGQWKVVKCEKNPTWYNRGSAWAENMPASLPPGPGNPLGTRAMTINGGGVLIHGTSDTGSVGYSASHGCVRMYMRDVEALFPQVNVGMPVYIIKQSGKPGFDCSKKPYWWNKE